MSFLKICTLNCFQRKIWKRKSKRREKAMNNNLKKPVPGAVRKGFSIYAAVVLAMVAAAVPVFADGDPLTVINNLSNFVFGLIRAVGIIIAGWGIVQVGISVQSHDPSQRSNGFLTLAGGIIIIFAKEILNLIMG